MPHLQLHKFRTHHIRDEVCRRPSFYNYIFSYQNHQYLKSITLFNIFAHRTLLRYPSPKSPSSGRGLTIGLSASENLVNITFKISYCIVEERLLESLVHDVLEEVALETFCMTHLSEDLTVPADDSLNRIV